MLDQTFRPGTTYENVYLVVLDASGYSNIVRHNPRDQATRAFDLLRKRITSRLASVSAGMRCARAALWSWRGDGGILAIHDDHESTARDVALTTARDVLEVDLQQIRADLRHTELNGELRLRVAVHKGTIRFGKDRSPGVIHSPDINFTVHLEEATPPDCLAISGDVHRSAGRHATGFTLVDTFEDRDVYLMTPRGTAVEARRAWLDHAGPAGNEPVFALPERPSQQEKARLIAVAEADVVNLGTACRSTAGYLGTTERPARYRDALLSFLERGGTYRCVLLDAACETTVLLSRHHQEDLAAKIRSSMVVFARFKDLHGAAADAFQVYETRSFPGFAATATDLGSPHAMILYSPYTLTMKPLLGQVQRADLPHYLVTSRSPALRSQIAKHLTTAVDDEVLERVL